MDTIVFDRLAYTETLKRSGIDEAQAVAHANALDTALKESVATRHDIEQLKADMDVRFGETRHDIEQLKADMDVRFTEVEARMDTRFAEIAGETKLNRWMLALVIAATVIPLIRDFL